MLNVKVEKLHEAEGHRERDRYRERHQESGPPLPEPDQRNQDHKQHGLPEASVEQIEFLAHLALLIGGYADDEIRRKRFTDILYSRRHGSAEAVNLPALLHLSRERDRATSPPASVLISPCVIGEVSRGVLVATSRHGEVAQIERRSIRRLRENNIVDVVQSPELSRLLEFKIPRAGAERTRRESRVAVLHDPWERRRRHAERRQSVLRSLNLNLFFEQPDPDNPRSFGGDLDCLFYAIGEIVKLAIRVLRAGMPAKRFVDRRIRREDNRVPNVRVDVCALGHLFPDALDGAREIFCLLGRRKSNPNEALALNQLKIGAEVMIPDLVIQLVRRFPKKGRIYPAGAAKNDIHW